MKIQYAIDIENHYPNTMSEKVDFSFSHSGIITKTTTTTTICRKRDASHRKTINQNLKTLKQAKKEKNSTERVITLK